jgi:Fungal trichothecene efflux pump (TRI12)
VTLSPVAEVSLQQKLCQTDWVGGFLFVGSMTAFLMGISWGGVQHPWRSAQTLAPIFVSVATLGVLILWELRYATRTLVPLSLFHCPSAIAAFYCALANGLVVSRLQVSRPNGNLMLTRFRKLFTGLYYVPFYFMSVQSASPIRSGIALFPALVFILPGSIVVAALTTRLGRFRWAIWIGWTITAAGCGLLQLLEAHTKMVVTATALAVFGIGSGMVLSSVNFAVQSMSKVGDAAMAASMYGFMRSLGMPIGVAVSLLDPSRRLVPD